MKPQLHFSERQQQHFCQFQQNILIIIFILDALSVMDRFSNVLIAANLITNRISWRQAIWERDAAIAAVCSFACRCRLSLPMCRSHKYFVLDHGKKQRTCMYVNIIYLYYFKMNLSVTCVYCAYCICEMLLSVYRFWTLKGSISQRLRIMCYLFTKEDFGLFELDIILLCAALHHLDYHFHY